MATGVNLFGTSGTDYLLGSPDDDTILGFAGDDVLDGSFGADVVDGGTGADLLRDGGGDIADTLFGSAGADSLEASVGNDYLDGGGDDDSLVGGLGNDTLLGGTGNDTLQGDLAADWVDGGDGDDWIYGFGFGGGSDTLFGGLGNDTIEAEARSGVTAVVDGGDGNDLLVGYGGAFSGAGTVQATGGAGRDLIFISGNGFFATPATVAAWVVSDFDAGPGGDQVDLISHWAVHPGLLAISETLGYTGGNPFGAIGFLQLDTVSGGTVLQWDPDGAAGGSYSWQTVMTLEGVSPGDLTADNFLGRISPDGSAAGTTESGTTDADFLLGTIGNDTLSGLNGNDVLDGVTGEDWLDGGDGNDSLRVFLGGGSDTLIGGLGEDTLLGTSGGDSLDGGDGADFLLGGGNSTLSGAAGNDTLIASNLGGSLLDGGSDDDYLEGGSGDTLQGGLGNDTIEADLTGGSVALDGGDGDDFFRAYISSGGSGLAQASGGAGSDVFNVMGYGSLGGSPGSLVASVPDWVVSGFVAGAGGDRIDVISSGFFTPGLLDISGLLGYNGGNPFGALGFLQLAQDTVSGAALLRWDPDGASGGAYTWNTVMTLSGVDADSLTGANFTSGISPDGAVPDSLIGGTTGNDNLAGTVGNDTLNGLAGDDTLAGNFGADSLDGGEDHDVLSGGGGASNDTLLGGLGNDTLSDGSLLDGGDGADLLSGGDTLLGGLGNDTLSVGDYLDGGDGADSVTGFGSTALLGGAGNDTIEAAAGASDFINVEGGDGDDLLIASGGAGPESAAGWIIATGGAGIDRFYAAGSGFPGAPWTASPQSVAKWAIEDFVAGPGGDQIDLISSQSNEFKATAGLLLISGTLGYSGGNPFDPALGFLRLTQSGADAVLEWDPDGAAGSAYTSWIPVMSFQGVDVDDFTSDNFVGRLIVGTAADDSLLGGLGNDTVQGLAGNDTLDGASGQDTMEGGSGSDTYYVDNADDLVAEGSNTPGGLLLPGGGGGGFKAGLLGSLLDGITDTVIAAVNYSLENLAYVERISLTGDATTATGNELANTLEGNELGNLLLGLGGNDTIEGLAGNDTLDGGRGIDNLAGGADDDTCYAGVTPTAGASRILFVPDVLVEGTAQGLDTVRSNASFALPGNVENLILTGAPMWRAYTGTGNDLDNVITGTSAARQRLLGNAGDDTLTGGSGADTLAGGTGADKLGGGTGADVFLFDTAPSADTVLDFASGTDHIDLENAIFTVFGATGAVDAQNVQVGVQGAISATSGDASDFLKYATDTGNLYYDSNGSAAGGFDLIATLYSSGTTAATLVPNQDIVIV